MNALLLRLVQVVFIGCGVILVLWGMDFGSSEHPTFMPGIIVLGMAGVLNWILQADKDWKKPIVHPWALIFSIAGWWVALIGCLGLIGAVRDYFREYELGDWFWSAMKACVGLLLARVGSALSK